MTDTTAAPAKGHHLYSGEWNAKSIYVMVVLTLIYTFNFVDRQILALTLPLIKRDMQLSDFSLGIISGFAFVLFYSILGVPIARLADRSNRRNILTVGLAFWSLMTALTGAVSNAWQLAATRFLMGAGEASGPAPTQSMVADIFNKSRRPMAMALLASATSLAALFFFPIVGWIAEHWGWRMAFVVAGVVGIFLAVLLFFTVPEPTRERTAGGMKQESFAATARFLSGATSYVLVLFGGAFMGVYLYAAQVWTPTFLTRVHDLNMAQVGISYGMLRGIAGLTGALLGGYLADRLGRKDERWRLWVPGLACMMVLPAELLLLLAPTLGLSLTGLALCSLFQAMHFGPIYAVCQTIAKPTMRATAAAIFLLFANLVGQIIGPMAVGWLNDHWAATYGDLAIRYSLILGGVCAGIGGLLMFLGAWRLSRDVARAEA